MAANAELAEQLNKAWRFFYARGFIDGFGHISARGEDPDTILVSPHSVGPNSRAQDFVLADLSGRVREGNAPLPGELPIHLEIYKRRRDVGSVAHFHCLHATSFSMSDVPLKPSYFMAAIFRGGIPIHPNPSFVNTSERGAALAATLGNARAALIRAHGVVVAAPDVVEMVGTSFLLEDNARRTWIAASMGNVKALGEDEAEAIEAEILKNRGPFRRIWSLCEQEYDG